MAALADRPAAPSQIQALRAFQDAGLLQGPKSLTLQRAIDDVVLYWIYLAPAMIADSVVAKYEYHAMPPKRTVKIAATLQVRGRGKPMPYVIGDDQLE